MYVGWVERGLVGGGGGSQSMLMGKTTLYYYCANRTTNLFDLGDVSNRCTPLAYRPQVN